MKAELLDCMGSDLTVVNAARVSFDRQHEALDGSDARLIRYLAKHEHWTPFGHPQVSIRETVPLFVARQRFKHQVGFVYNEVSRRYVDTPPGCFYPESWRARPQGSVKQGSGGDLAETTQVRALYADAMHQAMQAYADLLAAGVAPEQARMVLPQSAFTSYWVTGSLAAWARAYRLRIDDQAQAEIRALAVEWDRIIRPLFPLSWSALTELAHDA
jgi:thymidylate synthase (FAD)